MLAKNLFTTLRYCLALGLFLSFPVSAYAQETDAGDDTEVVAPNDQPTIRNYGAWKTVCFSNAEAADDTLQTCFLRQSQNVRLSDGGVFSFSMIMSSNENGIQVEMGTPLGVDLTVGVILLADKEELETLPFVTCRASVCAALNVFERDTFLEGFQDKDQLNIEFKTLGLAKPYQIAWSLDGFVEAYESIF